MISFFSAIGDALGAIGDFFSSIFDMISYLITFIYTCIQQCSELLLVVPSFIYALITAAVVFVVILACKRAVID